MRRDSTWIVRRISSSRPITGSSLPCARLLGEVARVFLQRVVALLGGGGLGLAPLAQIGDGLVELCARDAGLLEDVGGRRSARQRHARAACIRR